MKGADKRANKESGKASSNILDKGVGRVLDCGKLWIIPTPIGNLRDITLRAIDTIKECDYLLCEDTRTTRNLLKHLEIEKRTISHHKFNEHTAINSVINDIKSGVKVGLVSDAGTPAISDPGFLVARSCIENGIEIETLPGATALIPALVNSGFPCDRFIFEGFLPIKKGRLKRLEALKYEYRTIIFYESPHRIIKSLEQFAVVFGSREISISREITKIYEETLRGSASELLEHFKIKPPKGEFVVVISAVKSFKSNEDSDLDKEDEESIADKESLYDFE